MKERIVRFVAGTMILVSVALAYFVALEWLFLTCLSEPTYYSRPLQSFAPWS